MNKQIDIAAQEDAEIASDFVFETEHPVLPVPFTAQVGDQVFQGTGLSLTAAHVIAPGPIDPGFEGSRHIIKLEFNFEGFSIDLFPEARLTGLHTNDLKLQFIDPTGPHLPQLRYILNSFIAGDFVSLGAMMAYTGPVKPKPSKVKAGGRNDRADMIRRIGAIVLSVVLIAVALNALRLRYTQSYEARPVFITREGKEMQATSPGQISMLNPRARAGQVVYAISSNSGDTLNFVLPCDCDVTLADGIYEGATVLPSDPILTFFDSSVQVRVQSQMSIEGLTKAMNGEQVWLDLGDGRSVPVDVVLTSATDDAAQNGDLYLPVVLRAEDGALTPGDIGKPARVRLSKSIFGGSLFARKAES
ncbi:hypothetical protein [Oceaniglobus roseus]|uniref:hypothetical protein n=1 Tax=Oceaniglobus roseus TaxID=1737570 RepID=UPI000C7EC296|nr:hypothetical protein [Kandeliimicrobium roseum]